MIVTFSPTTITKTFSSRYREGVAPKFGLCHILTLSWMMGWLPQLFGKLPLAMSILIFMIQKSKRFKLNILVSEVLIGSYSWQKDWPNFFHKRHTHLLTSYLNLSLQTPWNQLKILFKNWNIFGKMDNCEKGQWFCLAVIQLFNEIASLLFFSL